MTQLPLPLAASPEPLAPRRGLLELSQQELQDWLTEHGEKPWRARQLTNWLLVHGVQSFDDMTDLPRSLRQDLAGSFVPLAGRVVRHLQASDGTHKLLVEFGVDRGQVECVLIQEDQRRTACISTQVGCGMGCVFCASGLEGLQRNLTSAEILEQLLRLRALPAAADANPPSVAAETGPRLTHIVVMGMGEPLANLDNLLLALDEATSPRGLGLSARHVTISTVGLPTRIRQLADAGKAYHLAVSLHAPNDPLRHRIVPTNDRTGLEAILAAAEYFFEKTGRQVTFEYVLLAGINDDVSHARELARLLQGRRAHVNLIPFNEVSGLPFARPGPDSLAAFLAPLKQHGISVKVRKRKGSQIDAACGQLRRAAKNAETSIID